MRRFDRDQLLRFSPVLAIVATILLVIASVAGAGLAERDFREQKVQQARAHASVLAASVSAAIAFQDVIEAQRAVDILHANPDVVSVGVYESQGTLFAARSDTGSPPPQRITAASPGRFVGGHARITTPIVQGGDQLGWVYVELTGGAGAGRWLRYIGVALLLLMAAILIALASAAQRALSAANAELVRRADALTESNAQLTIEISERQKAQTALAQSQKMEAIGQLTGGIAHDFNNLLMVISSGLRLLETRKSEDQRSGIVTSMRQAVDRGASLTKQLLAFSRRQKLAPEVVIAQERIESLRTLLERSLREDIALKFDFVADNSAIKVDPAHFDLAILNLAVNARDAMPDGGLVSIQITEIAEADETWVSVSVADNGAGMSPGVAARAFDPFFTTKEVGKGTGLGLSQVYGFALQSGGRCELETAEGQGTTVTLVLPRSDEAPVRVKKPMGKMLEAGTGTVLVVEDDDAVANVVCEMVNDLGYKATRAPNAQDALERIERGLEVDIVFSDIIMPGGLNGIELASELRRRSPALSILLTTGYAGRSEEFETRGFRILRKPYDRDELGAALAEITAR